MANKHPLLTKREQKIADCIVASIATGRECDADKSVVQLVEEFTQAVDAVIEVCGSRDVAEQLDLREEES
jgi:hypothetical protein